MRDGILDSGGFPIEFPVMSLGETLMRPTTMLFRNQAAMDVEESIRANPFDGVVLLMPRSGECTLWRRRGSARWWARRRATA